MRKILTKKNIWILLGLTLLGALVLRMLHMNDMSLWLDEGITFYNSSPDSFAGVWERVATLDQSPPGYYLFMHVILGMFGVSEFVFRLVPVLIGVLTVWSLYLLVTEIFGREAGLVAAMLLAANSFHIGFSMENRMFGPLALEAVLGAWLLLRAMRGRNLLYWLGFGAVSLAAIYTHNFGAFVLMGFAGMFVIEWFVQRDMRMRNLLLGLLTATAVVLLFLPWFPSFLQQLEVERYWMAPIEWAGVQNYFYDFARGHSYLMSFYAIVTFAGVLGLVRRTKEVQFWGAVQLVVFCLIALGVPFVYSQMVEPILKVRYVIYLLPMWMGLAALGVYQIRRASMTVAVVFLLLIFYANKPWQVAAYPVEIGEDLRGVVEAIEQREDNAKVVVHTPSIAHVLNFYKEKNTEVLPFPDSDNLLDYDIDESVKPQFQALLKELGDYYLVIGHTHETPHGILEGISDVACREKEEVLKDETEATDEIIKLFHYQGCGQR